MNLSPERNFSLARLENLLGYRNVFWRHDVDYSLEAAMKMADYEFRRGIQAHFFLFLDGNCPFYSQNEAFSAAESLKNLGHFIGEHIDERKVNLDHILTPFPVSFHVPTEAVLWKDLGFRHMYEPKWRTRYIADSRGQFKMKFPENLLDIPATWQVNLHPEWWFERNWLDKISEEQHRDFFYCEKPQVGA